MSYAVDHAVEAMRQANPVPDAVSLADAMTRADVFLTTTKETTGTMGTNQQTTTRTPDEQRRPRRNRMAFAAAFLVVIVVGAAIAVVSNNQGQETASPTDIAQEFIDALNAGDVEAAVQLMSVDASTSFGGSANTADEFAMRIEWLAALGWTHTWEFCEEAVLSTGGTEIVCLYEHGNEWSRALGLGPFTEGGQFTFVTEGGEITAFDDHFVSGTFSSTVWDVFVQWVRVNDRPQLVAVLSDGCCTPIMTPESIVIWERLTNEFVEDTVGNS